MLNKLLVATCLLLAGCAAPAKETPKATPQVHLQHPQVLRAPADPGVSIKVITKERLDAQELPDRAYVGFAYSSDWLPFAKWMHEYKAYVKSLEQAVEAYKKQDTRNDELQ